MAELATAEDVSQKIPASVIVHMLLRSSQLPGKHSASTTARRWGSMRLPMRERPPRAVLASGACKCWLLAVLQRSSLM